MKLRTKSITTRALPRSLKAFASAATLFAVVAGAHAQVVYSTGFETAEGYNEQNELTLGQVVGNPASIGQEGWTTNDPDNVTQGVGGYVAAINGYTGGNNYVGTAVATGGYADVHGAFIGGDYRLNYDATSPASASTNFDTLPAVPVTYLANPAFAIPTLATSYTFSIDSTVTSSAAATASQPNASAQDSFGYTFRNGAGTTLFSVNFTKSLTQPNTDAITYTPAGGAAIASTNGQPNGVTLNGRYHFNITVTATGFSLSFYSAANPGVVSTPFSNASLLSAIAGSGGVLPNQVTQIDPTWTLTNQTTVAGAYEYAGSNSMIFDNYVVSVPEPSTYAMMGVGFLGLIALLKFRRRQA